MKPIFASLLTAACILSRAHANSQATLEAASQELTTIQTLTNNLTATIRGWNGTDAVVALEINTLNTNIVNYIEQNATTQLKAIPATFDTTQSFEIGAPTQLLAYSVNASVAALIAQKGNFSKNGFTPIVITGLTAQLNASNGFSSVLLSYVPDDIRPVANALNGQITASLMQGLDCFNNINTSCITAVADPYRTYNAAVDSGAIKAVSAAPRTVDYAGAAAMGMAVLAAAFTL